MIANGDIDTFEKSLEVLRLSNADGLMIGRAAQGRPWIFDEWNAALQQSERKYPLEKNFLRAMMIDHLNELHRFYGEKKGVRVARKHLVWYFESFAYAGDIRHQAVRADSAREQLRHVEAFFDDSSRSLAA